MFHAFDGLYFERLPDGSVRIVKTDGKHQPGQCAASEVVDMVLTSDTWASIISSVSAGGEEDYRWYLAKAFHESKGNKMIVSAKDLQDLRKTVVDMVDKFIPIPI